MAKREGYISWDEFFMGAAVLCAERSKDPNTQVGACIVNDLCVGVFASVGRKHGNTHEIFVPRNIIFSFRHVETLLFV